MEWGGPWSSRWGYNDDMVKLLELKEVAGGVRVRALMADGYAQNCRLCLDGVNSVIKKVGEGTDITEIAATWPIPSASMSPNFISHTVSLVPIGDATSPLTDATFQQIFYMMKAPDRVRVNITAKPTMFAYTSGGTVTQLSSWVLTGLKRFKNCKPVANRKTWARLSLELATDAGTHTLTLSVDSVAVASGSRTGDGSITLTEENSSGISGTVALVYSADISGGTLIARFSAQYKIHHRNGTPFGGGDFPRTAEATVYDDASKTEFFWASGTLTAGTEYFVVHQVDEDGNESNGTANTTVEIFSIPAAAGIPSWVSGGYSASIIHWLASATANASYNIYDSRADGALDMGATINYLVRSEQFGASWTLAGGAGPVTSNIAYSPDGTLTADLITLTGGRILQDTALAVLSGGKATFSVWLKAAAPGNIKLEISRAGSNQIFKTVAVTTDWQRFFVTHDGSFGGAGVYRAAIRGDAVSPTLDVYAWGAQLEQRDGVSLYVPTAAAAAGSLNREYQKPGSGTISHTLGSISSGFTGTRYIVVKSELNGIESTAVKELQIKYVAGVVQDPNVPPAPFVSQKSVSITGRIINVPCSVNVAEQIAAPASIKLWIVLVGGTVNYAGAADGTLTAPARVGKTINGTVQATAGANGNYMVYVRTVSAGGVQSENTDSYGPYALTLALPSDPTVEVRGGSA